MVKWSEPKEIALTKTGSILMNEGIRIEVQGFFHDPPPSVVLLRIYVDLDMYENWVINEVPKEEYADSSGGCPNCGCRRRPAYGLMTDDHEDLKKGEIVQGTLCTGCGKFWQDTRQELLTFTEYVDVQESDKLSEEKKKPEE